MDGMMQPGPTLWEAEERRKKRGSQGLLGAIGEPMSYAPGLTGLLGNAALSAQYLTGEKPLDEGLSALALMTGLLQGTKVAPIMRNAIKVYHGSPHKFEKADSSKIGTGEGAQAYGHGLYWAEAPQTASIYMRGSKDIGFSNFDDVGRLADKAFAQAGGDKEKALKILDDAIGKTKGDSMKMNLRFARKAVNEGNIEKAHLYEASLRWPDPAREAKDPLSAKHFLDWDKPLSEQPKAIRDAVHAAGSNLGDNWPGMQHLWRIQNKSGGAVSGMAPTSKKLNELGIPGITYLDAGSRAAGEGTRNYVTFDDALVELLKRNGVGLLGR